MSFDVRIGINPVSWIDDDLPAPGGETPLAEGKAIGHEGFELGNTFPREPEALRAVLARRGLACGVRLAYHHHMGACVETTEDVDRLMSLAGPEVGLRHDTGHVTFAGGDWPPDLERRVAALQAAPDEVAA